MVDMATKRKHFKILSKTSGQIPKLFGTNGLWETLYQNCSNYLTGLKIQPPGGVARFSNINIGKTYFLLSETARPSKVDNTS